MLVNIYLHHQTPISFHFFNRFVMKKVKSYLALIVLALAFAMGTSDLQAQACPGGSGCTACNPVVKTVKESNPPYNDGTHTTYYLSATKSICGDACSYATGTGSFEWMVMNCSGATILLQSNGFASVKVPNSSACVPGSLSVGFRFKAITTGGTSCWSAWKWKNY
jgi:hypothetical protein